MKQDWLIDLCMSSEGQRDGQKETTECESGSGRGVEGWGSRRSMDEAWPPDGGRRVLNQTETNGVWETERKKFRHAPADLNPFLPTNQYREMHVWACVSVYVCVCVSVWAGRDVLVYVAPNKDQKHSDITSTQSDSPLASQPLHMPLFNFGACNPIKAWEVWST